MKIDDPDIYFGKRIKIKSTSGRATTGKLYGYSYDYDDDENELLEIVVKCENGFYVEFSENEITKIEIIEKR